MIRIQIEYSFVNCDSRSINYIKKTVAEGLSDFLINFWEPSCIWCLGYIIKKKISVQQTLFKIIIILHFNHARRFNENSFEIKRYHFG